ncbi:TusE/DsrC/DsvC family sulfur relay protein [Azohydromonas sp.]|uniref:TusE/DsrC/DsvC family sulfur relay protein n=1 Tax=Azohydromonas sp. TaxID=1872666 RepID=UPI002BA0E71B|nr:TusE/DsrC/DsvC family sulfur relay protein [Azohydromonas sp.]HMM84855.1 TusE/DsrC/DsvC family sulfur relay protein [Azohydromonas sp.]
MPEAAVMVTVHSAVAPLARAAAAPQGTLDDDGFLRDPRTWTRALAERLAAQAGIGVLGAAHWRVIDLVRRRFFAVGALPVMRLVCRAAGLDPRQGHALFGSCVTLWRIAGLPHPGDEALAYMH